MKRLQVKAMIKECDEGFMEQRASRLTHYINGVQMSKVIDNNQARRRDSGLIAIELHAGAPMTVQVRRVRIRTASSSVARTPENNPNQDAEVQFDLPKVEVEPGVVELKAENE